MIVYREAGEETDPRADLAACAERAAALSAAGSADHDEVTGLLIDVGMVEAAVADALCPAAEAPHPVTVRLRQASLAAGRLFRLSCRGSPQPALQAAADALARTLRPTPALPASVPLRVPEGYAYYALYPETYLAAAEQWAAETCPDLVVCLGIRSIGTSLSAVVAAASEACGAQVESLTLRPRGHPFDRRPALPPPLADRLRSRRHDAWFLIVDEGPGLSASSFCGTAAMLAELGVPDSRIVLFPSHLPDPAGFRSAAARERWTRHRKAHVPCETGRLPGTPFPADSRDLSGGVWRSLLDMPEGDWPAVQPQHERRKYLEGSVLHKFVGLGRYGTRAFRRAQTLAEKGFTPPVRSLRGGFLAQPFVPGRPLRLGEIDQNFLVWAVCYFNHISSVFSTGRAAEPHLLLEMTRTNILESLGPDWTGSVAELEQQSRSFGDIPAIAGDARVMPHEWLRTPDGWLKTDALDHHADHFYPGPTDIAWDVAGFGVEFGLSEAAITDFAIAVGGPTLPARLPFHRTAYLAFRLGYTTLAAETLAGSADGSRMARLVERYRQALQRQLASL